MQRETSRKQYGGIQRVESLEKCHGVKIMEAQKTETRTICFNLPLGAFSALRKTPDEFTKEMRLAAAVKWYELGIISQEKAAEIADMGREDFLMELSKFNVSPFQYTAEEVLKEAGYE